MTSKPDAKNDLNHDIRNGALNITGHLKGIEEQVTRILIANNAFDPGTIKPQPLIVSPTGGPVRETDKHGMGHFGAPRGSKTHKGADYVGEPGQNIVSPIDGKVIRAARPYADDSRYNGLLISGKHLYIKIFYIEPDWSRIGAGVFQGKTIIGTMQDITKRYADITPHVHLQAMVDPELLRQ